MRGELIYHDGNYLYQYPTSNIWHFAWVQMNAPYSTEPINLSIHVGCRVKTVEQVPEVSRIYKQSIPMTERTCGKCDPTDALIRRQ